MDGTHIAVDCAEVALTSLNTGSGLPSLDSNKAGKIGGRSADSDDFDLESSIDSDHRLKKREALLALYYAKPMYQFYKDYKAKAKAIHAQHSQDSEEDQTCWDIDLPDTPKVILKSKRDWEKAFYRWKSAMKRVSFQ